MLFVKKKTGAAEASSAKPTGLFIDRQTQAADEGRQVIDMPVVDAGEAHTQPPVASASAEPSPSPTVKSSTFSSLRVKKAPGDSPVGQSTEAKPASGLSALRSRFGSKRPASPTGTEPALEKATSETLPEGKAAGKAAKAKAPKPAKAKTAAKVPKFGGKAEKRVTLLTELDNGRQLYWSVEASKLVQLQEAPTTAAYSFSREDFRYFSPTALSYRQANDLALQEVGEAVQVVNRTKDLQAVYATRQERALNAKHIIVPAQQALDRLLLERKRTGQALICGFHLKDANDDASVAVLFHVSTLGEASKPQISVNPDSMEFVIAQFSASRKVDKTATEVILFDNEEFLSALAGAVALPNEPVWRGVPVRKVLSCVAVGAMAVSLGLGGWAGYEYQQITSLKAKQARLQDDLKTKKRNMTELIMGAVPEFANVMSLDVPKLMERAQKVWIPETRLVMTADLTSAKYDLWLPVARVQTYNNRPTTLNPITVDQHQQLVNYTAPEGCERTPIGATGALNETQLSVTCETGNSALANYRND